MRPASKEITKTHSDVTGSWLYGDRDLFLLFSGVLDPKTEHTVGANKCSCVGIYWLDNQDDHGLGKQ